MIAGQVLYMPHGTFHMLLTVCDKEQLAWHVI
jgi:hypothetical protein